METEKITKLTDYARAFLIEKGPGFLLALTTLIVGFWAIHRITKIVKKGMVSRNMDVSLVPFVSSLINIGLKVLLIISVASMVGIATTSFVAILGAAGLAIGLALQGSLANFAGGVLILIFKPFKVGDLVQIQSETGTVKAITIFNTILTTPRGNSAYLPNGVVANDKIINYTTEANMRVDLTVGISYSQDIPTAKKVIIDALLANPLVLEDPPPFVGVHSMGDNSVNLVFRPYVESGKYWDAYFSCNEDVKIALDKAKISIPFPQRDIHIVSGKM